MQGPAQPVLSGEVVDVTADSDDGSPVKQGVVDVTVDVESENDDIAEVIERNSSNSPPLVFRGYRRGRELGRGASGYVFVCKRKGHACGFAVKAIDLRRTRLSPNEEREQKKLRREVDILKKLPPHDHIVPLIDAFQEGDWFLLVLELVGGGDLFTVLTVREPSRLFEREASFVLRQLADGLAFLHSQGVIHRDLKLENVLVASERRERRMTLYSVKITDFGLSKAVGAGLSDAKSRVGTRPYAAPEIWGGETYDFRSDLWSLGVLLYVLLAGHFPFSSARIPTNQVDLDSVVERLKSTDAAQSMVRGLLQFDPSKRQNLQAMCQDAWMAQSESSGDATSERPAKRQCLGEPPRTERVADSSVTRRGPPVDSEMPPLQVTDLGSVEQAVCADETAEPSPPSLVASPPASVVPLAVPVASTDVPSDGGSMPLPPPAISEAPDGHEKPAVQAVTFGAANVGICSDNGAVTGERGAATPACSSTVGRLKEVLPVSLLKSGEMQLHMVVPDGFAGAVLGKSGTQLKHIGITAGCQVWLTARDGANVRNLVAIGNYTQCATVQDLAHKEITKEYERLRSEGQEASVASANELEVALLVRAEAAGVVIGKQGFVLRQIREQSGARIHILREEVEGQRPCMIAGSLQSVLLAERHVFDLVRVVPTAGTANAAAFVRAGGSIVGNSAEANAAGAGNAGKVASVTMSGPPGGPDLPRLRVSTEPVNGRVLVWKGKFGWIRPAQAIDHPSAMAHKGHIYVHENDIVDGRPLWPGQSVSFHVYSDKTGLGAEACCSSS
eukprot:TRINITY_DN2094_c2_g1_i4.p1 TRINITY_DN2094_c2_g1~~TRINITY_DN2094_c2_g1_i4.p1  ORF type:complete len:787 (+),score=146.27 TRINITY_DN2094_c2_g1_i4:166-2526(+)